MDYTALQVKTSYSILESLNNISELVSKASDLGYTSLSITDNNMYGVMEFYKECIKNDIKPIIGVDFDNYLLFAKNYNGYQKQKGLNTVQGKIEEALKYINNSKETKIHSSGRTDAHVHAINQYGHVDIDVEITEYKLKCALNSLLPNDIYVTLDGTTLRFYNQKDNFSGTLYAVDAHSYLSSP